MPEVTGEATITLYLTKDDLYDLLALNEGEKANLSCGNTVQKQAGAFEIESTQEVTLEFELSDYAPERDEP